MSFSKSHDSEQNSEAEQIAKRVSGFENEVEKLLCSSDETFPILPVIERWLSQLKVKNKYKAKDVFLKAYREGIKEIQSGREIRDVVAYLKAKSFAIIRNASENSRITDNDNRRSGFSSSSNLHQSD